MIKAEYEMLKSKDEVWDLDDEDEDAVRLAFYEELESGETDFEIFEFE